jgi:hypothetical protein
MLTFANPLGFWALLGVPAVLAIHFLQRRARKLPVSTLFLLEKTQRESISGRRFERLVSSVPLWLQLLAVLLLTWLLIQPRIRKPNSTQRVAVVLDASASMGVFTESLQSTLAEELPSLRGAAAVLDLTLLDASEKAPTLYTGNSIPDALDTLADWKPRRGLSDPTPALQLARSLVGREGLVIYATDAPTEDLPFDASTLAVGEPTANVGITGVRWEVTEGAWVWRAVVRNYSDEPVDRSWHLELPGGRRTSETGFRIEANGLVSLQAALPAGADRGVLVLSPDRFTLDDRMPLLPPMPKMLELFAATAPEHQAIRDGLLESLDALQLGADSASADLRLISYDPLDPRLPQADAIVFVRDETRGSGLLRGNIIAEPHPLVAGLNWQALMVREGIGIEQGPFDEVLLWQDTRPLILLRTLPASAEAPACRQLCFNFDPARSNLIRQPAFIVCLHRFIEGLRTRKVAATRTTLETGQPLQLAADPTSPLQLRAIDTERQPVREERLPATGQWRGSAPLEPGFLEIRQDGETLLQAAVHFADTREADLRGCGSAAIAGPQAAASIERHTLEDAWWRAWVLVLILVLLGSWYFGRGHQAEAAPAT